LIRDRKVFLERQAQWNDKTKKTVATLQSTLRNRIAKNQASIAKKAKEPANLSCINEESELFGSDDEETKPLEPEIPLEQQQIIEVDEQKLVKE
jgi:hypothetical protein